MMPEIRVAISSDARPDWQQVLTVALDNPDTWPTDLATALRELANETETSGRFEQIRSQYEDQG